MIHLLLKIAELTDKICNVEDNLIKHGFDFEKAEKQKDKYHLHPIIKNREAFKALLESTEGDTLTNYNFPSYDYIELCAIILACDRLDGIEDILKNLIVKESYFDAYYELVIAGMYLGSKHRIEKVNEKPNTKNCDFRIKSDNKSIFIECKNIEDWNSRESILWEKFFDRYDSDAHKKSNHFNIVIKSKGKANGELIRNLYTETRNIIRNYSEKIQMKVYETSTIAVEETKEEIVKTDLEPLAYIKDVIKKDVLKSNQGWCSCSVTPIKNNLTQENGLIITNLDRIIVLKDREIDYRRKIIDQIKKARKQLPKENPGLIYINLPLRKGEDYLAAIDNAYNDVFNEINRNSTRIHSVVLTSKIYQGGIDNDPVKFQSYIVPNYNCRHQLPDDFMIFTERSNQEVPVGDQQDEGSFELTCLIDSRWRKEGSISILNKVHKHGLFQFHLWKTWEHKIRFEIVRKIGGRLFVESELIDIDAGRDLKIKGIWNQERVGVSINGKAYFRN